MTFYHRILYKPWLSKILFCCLLEKVCTGQASWLMFLSSVKMFVHVIIIFKKSEATVYKRLNICFIESYSYSWFVAFFACVTGSSTLLLSYFTNILNRDNIHYRTSLFTAYLDFTVVIYLLHKVEQCNFSIHNFVNLQVHKVFDGIVIGTSKVLKFCTEQESLINVKTICSASWSARCRALIMTTCSAWACRRRRLRRGRKWRMRRQTRRKSRRRKAKEANWAFLNPFKLLDVRFLCVDELCRAIGDV